MVVIESDVVAWVEEVSYRKCFIDRVLSEERSFGIRKLLVGY